MPRGLSLALILLAGCSGPDLAWRPLFNGQDLAGWERVNCAPDTFTVRDGVIHCTGRPTGVLRTNRMYENFVLELEWRHLQPGGNAGLFVWSDPLPARGVPFTRCLEVQVMDGIETADYTSHGDIFSIWGARFLPDRPHPKEWERCLPSEKRCRLAPEWNHYRLTCRDGVITLEVNGEPVSGGAEASPRRGYLCLESEGSPVEFRDLEIAELPPTPVLSPDHIAEPAQAVQSLYTGLDLAGWSSSTGGEPDAAHWQARDWTLWTDGQGGALVGAALPASGTLRLDWRRTGAPSARVPLGVPGTLRDLPEAAKEGWHRLVLTWQGSRVRAELDGREVDLVKGWRAPGPEAASAVELRPDGEPIEFANLFLGAAD